MERFHATKFCRDELDKHGLGDWHIRLSNDLTKNFLGMCSYRDKCIILNTHHIDIHPEVEVVNTIRHEVAHALTPNHAHDDVWRAKALEIGCTSAQPCSHLALSPDIIDAIRSGADVQVEIETETRVEVIHKPKYTVTRLQDKCPECGKVAKTTRESIIKIPDETLPDKKFIFLECGHLIIKDLPKGTPFDSLISNWWKPNIASCNHSFVKNQCVNCAEYKAFEFQQDGARFLESALAGNNGGAILDEMGLGKTIQTLLYLKYHSEALPALFVVKSGIKFQWVKEIIRWLGPDHVAQVIERSTDIVIPGLKTYVISYDLMVQKIRKSSKGKTINQGFDIKKFENSGIRTIISDECQQLKNPDSARTQQFRKLVRLLEAKVIPLSGTPWKNRGSEFFTILNIIAPQKFWSFQQFKDRWVNYIEDKNGAYKEAGIKNPEQFKDYIKDIAIRREIFEVLNELPDVNRVARYIELDTLNQQLYDKEVSDFVKWYNEKICNYNYDSTWYYSIIKCFCILLTRYKHDGIRNGFNDEIWQHDEPDSSRCYSKSYIRTNGGGWERNYNCVISSR